MNQASSPLQAADNQQPQQRVTGAPLDGPADCTIACDKGHITAHKLILCDHSKYLQDILSKYPNAEHPIIILTELNINDIKVLVNFMYTGELVLNSDSSPTSLLRAAQILKIDSLTADDDEDEQEPDDQSQDLELEQQSHQHHQHQHHHHHHHQSNRHEPEPGDGQVDDEEEDVDEDDDDLMLSEADNNDNNNNNSPRIINSIRNIYSIIDDDYSSPPRHQQLNQQPLNKSNKIRCHLCNIGLSDVKCLYRHVLTRHLPEKWGYKCEFCDREFSRDDHLMRHYTTKHKNMEFNREKIRETRRLNREMAKNFHDQISTVSSL